MNEQKSQLRQQRATISCTPTRWSLSRSSWKQTSSTISRAWYLLMRSESSWRSSSKQSSRVHLPSRTISKQSTTLSLREDSTMRSKTSMKRLKEGRAMKGARSCLTVASLVVMFMRFSMVSKPATQRPSLLVLKDSRDLQQLNSQCCVNPLIWLPFLITCSSSDTSSCFSFPYSLLGHCEKLEKLLHFDWNDDPSIITYRLVSGFMLYFIAFSLSRSAGEDEHWLSRLQMRLSWRSLAGVASEASLILKFDYLLQFLCWNLPLCSTRRCLLTICYFVLGVKQESAWQVWQLAILLVRGRPK